MTGPTASDGLSAELVRSRLLARAPEHAATVRLAAGATATAIAAAADPDWLATRIAASARRWATSDQRVAGTLWWYSATLTLLAEPLASWTLTGTATDPSPENLLLHEGPDLAPVGAHSRRALASGRAGTPVDDLAVALRRLIGLGAGAVSALGGGGERALWSVASDALAGTLLRVDATSAEVEPAEPAEPAGSERAAALPVTLARAIGDPLPLPRFSLVPVARDALELLERGPRGLADRPRRRFVRRGSCCLIYLSGLPGGVAKCVSCPRQPPEDRLTRLAAAALPPR